MRGLLEYEIDRPHRDSKTAKMTFTTAHHLSEPGFVREVKALGEFAKHRARVRVSFLSGDAEIGSIQGQLEAAEAMQLPYSTATVTLEFRDDFSESLRPAANAREVTMTVTAFDGEGNGNG